MAGKETTVATNAHLLGMYRDRLVEWCDLTPMLIGANDDIEDKLNDLWERTLFVLGAGQSSDREESSDV